MLMLSATLCYEGSVVLCKTKSCIIVALTVLLLVLPILYLCAITTVHYETGMIQGLHRYIMYTVDCSFSVP